MEKELKDYLRKELPEKVSEAIDKCIKDSWAYMRAVDKNRQLKGLMFK